ncbi:MAG TPA: M15 family metallopeptidase [Polyangiaceae bacterium]
MHGPSIAPKPKLDAPPERKAGACNEQSPQEFLERAHLNHAAKSAAERSGMLKVRALATEYRTTEYGYFEGFGDKRSNPKSPAQQSKPTTFFGLSVVLHERVIPALHCVEEQLKAECSEFNYRPKNLSGLRRKNTYVDGEVSNHVYGIAIDIDPLSNPCCKCLEPWSSSERCRGKKTVWERMAMPRCWVEVFERFGFYWLGHDTLEDTMHFEFLGDPNRIERRDANVEATH